MINAAGENAEHAHQVSMTDSDFRLFIHFRLGVVGNTQSGNFDHRQIVRAIADGDGLFDRNGVFLRQTRQRIGFVLRISCVSPGIRGSSSRT
ncbi:Uncharacterised protein [Klebsiella pneumoniae]|nr:Uncharacterised protein [Klebsiella pneumoniae]